MSNNNNDIDVIVFDDNSLLLSNPNNYYLFMLDKIKQIALDNKIDIDNINQFNFSFICICIGDFYKNNPDLLMLNKKAYDSNKIELALDIFIKLLYQFGLTLYETDFIYFVGIDPVTFHNWKMGAGVTPKYVNVFKKLYSMRKESHEKHMTSGKVNPMAELAYLNHHENYTAKPEQQTEQAQSFGTLPRLSLSGAQNPPKTAQIAEFAQFDNDN